jgi:hypothetical protein
VMLDIICLAAKVYLPLFNSVSRAQRRATATSAAMINLMLDKSEKSAGCSVPVILRHSYSDWEQPSNEAVRYKAQHRCYRLSAWFCIVAAGFGTSA